MTNSQRPGGTESIGAGLCETCLHGEIVENDRGARFYLCARSKTDERFARYPRLPVVACIGYDRQICTPSRPRD